MLKEALEKTKSFLVRRQQAYQQTFSPESVFTKLVLEDLAKFCRANDTTFHPDSRMNAVLEGRREVWLRIQQHTKLDPDQLWKTYGRTNV